MKKETWTHEEVKAALDSQAEMLQAWDKSATSLMAFGAQQEGFREGCLAGIAFVIAGLLVIVGTLRGWRRLRRKGAPGE